MTPATIDLCREYISVADRQAKQPVVAEVTARVVVALFEGIRSESQAVQEKISRGEIEFDRRISQSFSALFHDLAKLFEQVKLQLPPDRLPDRFLEYLDTMRINQFDGDVVADAIVDMGSGKTISLAEGMDALRDSATP